MPFLLGKSFVKITLFFILYAYFVNDSTDTNLITNTYTKLITLTFTVPQSMYIEDKTRERSGAKPTVPSAYEREGRESASIFEHTLVLYSISCVVGWSLD